MNVIIPPKRRDGSSSFLKLVSYVSLRDECSPEDEIVQDNPSLFSSKSSQSMFNKLVNYIDRGNTTEQLIAQYPDGRQRIFSGNIACETNCFSLETSAAEMNMIAMQNRNCQNPVYHFILSWHENETPSNGEIFDCARYCLISLGLGSHQFVTAIHKDTDNIHCHVAVNRVNQEDYHAANMWNDADTLQKCCRVLERHYGFKVDNGSWMLNNENKLQRVRRKYKSPPCGAVKREIFSDKESLYHYAVRKLRNRIDEAINMKNASWEYFHLLAHENNLGLREHNEGLIIYDFQHPDSFFVKASSIHPDLTKSNLQLLCGSYEGPPSFQSDDPEEGEYVIQDSYNPILHVRDQALRRERREERAAAREILKSRYEIYRKSWQKPDLKTKERYQEISCRFREMKNHVRLTHSDPLIRKLMYRVTEFEQMKAMAALRLTLRKERETLFMEGKYRPLSFRAWTEQEALNGDAAALSQLRGWAYRRKRSAKKIASEKKSDRIILCDAVDDSPLLERPTHTSRLLRDGTVEYLRYGVTSVVDYGSSIEIKSGFDDYDNTANYQLAVEIASTKSGDHIRVKGEDTFVDQVLQEGKKFNQRQGEALFNVTDRWQKGRYETLDSRSLGYPERSKVPRNNMMDINADSVPASRNTKMN